MKFYIGFSTQNHPVSTTIRLIENAPYSHTYVKFYLPEYEEYIIYHATGSMIHFLREERFKTKNRVIREYEVELPDKECKNFIRNSFKKSGIPYGRLQIIGMLIVRLGYLWFGQEWKNPLSDGRNSQICSELIYYDLKKYFDFGDFKPEWDGPKELEKYVARFGKLIEENSNGGLQIL